jgi:hypothetical protein
MQLGLYPIGKNVLGSSNEPEAGTSHMRVSRSECVALVVVRVPKDPGNALRLQQATREWTPGVRDSLRK